MCKYRSVVIKIWMDRGSIDIVNFYNKCGRLSQGILEDVGGGIARD